MKKLGKILLDMFTKNIFIKILAVVIAAFLVLLLNIG